MKNKLQVTLLLGLALLLSSFTSNTKENNPMTSTGTSSFGQLKAACMGPTGKAYFFTDKKYYQEKLGPARLEKSDLIKNGFKGLVNNLDAALLYNNGKSYFFKDKSYYRYSNAKKKVEKTGVIGADGWKGVPYNVDAAVFHANGKTYFFKGSKYYRYDHKIKKVDKRGTIGIDGWIGVPDNIDAALLHPKGKLTYFFKGNKYYRYRISSHKVDKVGTIGEHGWNGLSFRKEFENTIPYSKDNLRLKVTLTRIKSIQARDSDNIADFGSFTQIISYKANGIRKRASNINARIGTKEEDDYYQNNIESEPFYGNSFIIHHWYGEIHVREGDENHIINNSLVYEIKPDQISDKRAEFKIKTELDEISHSYNIGLFQGDLDRKKIAQYGRNDIEVSIHEVLNYLQNPNSPKYGNNYFKGGRGGDMHEYGAFGDVMWFKRGSNNSLIGHLEFGDNNKETYVRLYYRFELV